MNSQYPITLEVNGKNLTAEVEARLLLVDFLRENLRLTGTHIGCDTSQCGACTIHLDGRAVKSCTMLATQAHGARLTTIEGVARNARLHPVQAAFKQAHGLQCGFCTPGMIMLVLDFLRECPDPSEAQIRNALDGNLCRCTGYHNIVRAVQIAAAELRA